jgi:hypothetical protein
MWPGITTLVFLVLFYCDCMLMDGFLAVAWGLSPWSYFFRQACLTT